MTYFTYSVMIASVVLMIRVNCPHCNGAASAGKPCTICKGKWDATVPLIKYLAYIYYRNKGKKK